MKKSLGILSVAAISMLTLTGCPGGGGSGNNAAVGVANGQINSIPNESCNVQPNYYSCTQTLNGVVLTSPTVSFSTQQEFCTKIMDNSSSTNMDPTRGQTVASQTRNQLFNERCQGVTGTNPISPTGGMKTFTCQISVKKGDMISEGQPQQVYLSQYLRKQVLPAIALKTSQKGFFQTSRWVRLANLTVEYSPAFSANTSSIDQLKMSVSGIDGDISASVIGYAGSENRIEIKPQDDNEDQTTLIATCTSADATATGLVKSTGQYQCIGEERADGRTTKISYVNQVSDVSMSGISITNDVFVQGDGNNGVTFSQSTNRPDDSVVTTRSTLNSPTSISIEKLSYSLKVKCQPK